MDVRQIQMLYASAGYYRGAIDGDPGPLTRDAAVVIERNANAIRSHWPWPRRLIAAAQTVLDAQGHEPGVIDGYAGHNTSEALTSWLSEQAGVPADVRRAPLPSRATPTRLPRQAEVATAYGTPGPGGTVEQRLGWAETPAPMRLDWDLDTTVTRLRVHGLCAEPLTAALAAVLDHYGEAEWRRLGLDRYAGGYNPRRMRGGTSWSMHAYGCAIDIFAAPNGLRTRCPAAGFCGSEYQPFLDIMERHGWLPAIRLWGADAMHFQMARL
ncbi:M15 family metallopeptidase [Oceaniovalibus sp. ACAM 378]|uniref:M15 family metallopeptidase n=1 Tax=Oceaniovalibus sp. ACAM 378 TaxID=2599923 RepID=UPI0011DA5742|nr:M15 family metallopeptidase [Oceaniovalibus sp. ACAM 378]TYB83980.1 M15 family peptidase [Oceaniovalibus sp. ACAM 378]